MPFFLPPGYVLIRATAQWQGERIEARDALPAEAWEDQKCRDQVKRYLRHAIADAIAERLDVVITARTEGA